MTDPNCFWEGFALRGGDNGRAGCFREGTKIRMADGSQKRVENIRAGDEVLRPLSNTPARVTKVVAGAESKPLYVIRHRRGEVVVTTTHPLLTRRGMLQAQQLRVGDELLQANGSYARIAEISRQATNRFERVWNFAIEGLDEADYRSFTVEADGVVSGDLTIQRELEQSGAGS